MQVIVLLDGLTFGGRVWKAGEFADTTASGFPTHALEPGFRDHAGRPWFRTVETPKQEEPKADVADVTACNKCGKKYKSAEWLAKHVEKCNG